MTNSSVQLLVFLDLQSFRKETYSTSFLVCFEALHNQKMDEWLACASNIQDSSHLVHGSPVMTIRGAIGVVLFHATQC